MRYPGEFNSYQVHINNERKPFNDPRVRRAINLAVSRQNLIKAFGTQEPIMLTRWMTHASEFASPMAELEKLPGYRADKTADIAEAKKLMAAAGLADGITFFMAIPSFWVGLMVVLSLVLAFTWRPPLTIVYLWDDPIRNLQMTTGPALVLGVALAAMMARITRSSVLEVLGEDYVRTARAKGLHERIVVWRHALVNAMLPILTVSGTALGALLGGSVAVERAFGVPGLGLALVFAVAERDWMLIQNLVLLYGTIFVLINLVIDVSYGWFDPRIRYQ